MMKKYLILAGLLFSSVYAHANVVINGTRIIYPEGHKDVVVQLLNKGKDPSLMQSWIDDGDLNSAPETANVPFLLSPPVVKVSGDSGQQLRIKKVGASLPSDRESVFYLNVLDIPPTPENLKGTNTLQLAIKSRIKLFYRPVGLKGGVDNAIKNIDIQASGKCFKIVNKSPYHLTMVNIINTDNKRLLLDSAMITPFSNAIVAAKDTVMKNRQYAIMYIDDFGAYKLKTVISH